MVWHLGNIGQMKSVIFIIVILIAYGFTRNTVSGGKEKHSSQTEKLVKMTRI